MNYHELKENHSKGLTAFPIAFAFSNEQLTEGLEKLNATEDEVLSIGGGGLIRKTDQQALTDMVKRHNREMSEAQKDDTFLKSAIIYELGNHEFCITYDPTDTVLALGLDLDDERVAKCFTTARKEYLANCE